MSLIQIYPTVDRQFKDEVVLEYEFIIIAVHGLDYVDATGTCAGSSWREPAGQVWLSVFLRENNIKARLFLYEYDSQDTFKGVSGNMSTGADDLIRQISTARTNFQNPIILIGHGLGGILIKQALVNATQRSDWSAIKNDTRGILFFGTPHTMNRQPSRWLNATFIPAAWNPKQPSSYYPQLLPRVDEFREQVEDYQFISFYGDADEVVPSESAVMQLPGHRETQVRLTLSHHRLCMLTVGSDDYRKVTRNLLQLMSTF
ncbi:hypothetical protein TCE0_044r16000 [Talaromyces pinophilus]|uniref:Uncharacterized protein n=1 Tax=Talaromyces pinophilus TaxID=128442 RepID=A0A478EAY5_TALPI|nr:hypothetical protein TCE0_044r16000 [Talaromyces pinophilus]